MISTMTTKAKILVSILGLAGLLATFTYLTISPNEVICEVCVEFRGVTECRRAAARDREEAEMNAASTACGLISGGVTDGIACRNTTPKSVACESR
jgi:hypothetical protein